MRLMSVTLAGVLACGAMLAPWAATAADFIVLKESGSWTAFQTKGASGKNICGIRMTYPDKREFYVKWFEGNNRLAVQPFKPTWAIPPNISANVNLTFAGVKPYQFKSVATTDTSNFLEFYVDGPSVQGFTKDLTTATAGSLQFPGGSEPVWPLTMTGVSGALDAMVRCIDTVAGPTATDTPFAYLHAPVNTQPFGSLPSGPATQPFGAPSGAPTQPFGGTPQPFSGAPQRPAITNPFAPP